MTMTASQVLATHWDGQLPVNVEAVARSMGVTLVPSGTLGLLSGQVEMSEGRPVVSFNQAEAPVRQRFTIAHELGHFALGHLLGAKRLLRDPAANFSSGSSSPVEREANAFAADLLMPEHVLRYAVNEKKMFEIARLANLFHVSQVAMRYRLQNLRMLGG